MPSSHVAISDVRSCVPRAPFVAVLRVLASPSATPKCLSGTSTWGTAAATRSHDFQVRNLFPECNTPLISAHGALSSTPCCRLIEGFGRVCAVTSIVDCSVRSIESIDGRYGGCWRRSSPKPPSHKPRRRLNSSSTPGPVDCARAVWRKRYPGWVPFGAAPPQVTPPPPPPRQSPPNRPVPLRQVRRCSGKPTRARALRRRRRSLARSIARAVCGGSDGVRLHRPSRALRASRVTRAHAHVIAAHRARRHRFPFPLHARMRALRAATALARSLARSLARCGVALALAVEVAFSYIARHARHARACTSSPRIARVITAPLPRTSPIRARGSGGGAVSFARLLARAEAEAVGLGEAVGYFARHAYQTRHVRRSSRARTRISSPLRARHHRFPSPPRTTGTRALLRRRRSLARSRACGVALAVEVAFSYIARHARASRTSRARACTSSPRIARVITAPLPRCHPCARAAAAAALSRLLARSRARRRRRWGWGRRSVTSRVTRVKHVTRVARHARARAYHHRFARVITVFRPPRARPARARCCGGGARSLARARAVWRWRWRWRWRSVTPRITRVTRARACTSSPRIARVITAPLPRCHPCARAAAVAALSRLLASSRAWRRRRTVIRTSCVSRASRARARASSSPRHLLAPLPLKCAPFTAVSSSLLSSLSSSLSSSLRARITTKRPATCE